MTDEAWTDWVSLHLFHGAAPDTALTDATFLPDGTIAGDAVILTARFSILETIDPGAPVQIGIDDLAFHLKNGALLTVDVQDTAEGRAIVTTTP